MHAKLGGLQMRLVPPAASAYKAAARAAATAPPARHGQLRRTVAASSGRRGAAGSLATDVNGACNAALQAMLAADEGRVPDLAEQLRGLRLRAIEAEDLEGDRLLRVVEGLLHHSVLKEADELEGPHAAALNRLINQVAGSEWKLVLEGQSAEGGPQEPRFSTWEEVRRKQERRRLGLDDGGGAAAGQHTALYELLGVGPAASQADVKAAYRRLALRLHPDVNQAPDAAARFAAVAAAYDVLSAAASRALYDRFGEQGMMRHSGAAAGSGNAGKAWDEFKPHKRQNKRTQARDASAASHAGGEASGSGAAEGSGGGDRWAAMPRAGTVVEYPLPPIVQEELQDGRSHGVGLLVGRNCDRGDAKKLPPEALDLCEVEPLRQQEAGSDRWIPDELGCSAYVRLGELTALPVDSFDQRFDVWVITSPLSPGCGGPELPEEVML